MNGPGCIDFCDEADDFQGFVAALVLNDKVVENCREELVGFESKLWLFVS